jgi:hypothetical protein
MQESEPMELNPADFDAYIRNETLSMARLPLFIRNEFAADKALAVIGDVSRAIGEDEVDVIVSSPPVLAHTRIDSNKRHSKAELCALLIDKLHHDILPYTEIIVLVPKHAKDALTEAYKRHFASGTVPSAQ